jgi:hypothetical protein
MILVDRAVWAWRGRHWAHLVSDSDYRELHAFAAGLGLARVAFQGDHYDVDETTRLTALTAGAIPVDARELLRRLREGGLRRPAARRPWRWRLVAEWQLPAVGPRSEWPAEAAPLLAAGLAELAGEWAAADGAAGRALRLMSRSGERAAVLVDPRRSPSPPLAELVVEVDDSDDASAVVAAGPAVPGAPGPRAPAGT